MLNFMHTTKNDQGSYPDPQNHREDRPFLYCRLLLTMFSPIDIELMTHLLTNIIVLRGSNFRALTCTAQSFCLLSF